MILSNDNSAIFISVPKTGSTTARTLLAPYSQDLSARYGIHCNRSAFHPVWMSMHPENPMTGDEAWAIPAYAFFRDPVERYISAATFARRYPTALRNLFPEYFSEGAPYDLSVYNLPQVMQTADFLRLPNAIRQKIIDPSDPETLFYRIMGRVEHSPAFQRQSDWFRWKNTIPLNYANFEAEMRRLIGIFGGDTTMTIPVMNEAPIFIPTTPITTKIIDMIKDWYWQDYEVLDML